MMKKIAILLLLMLILGGVGYYGYMNYLPSNEVAAFNPKGTPVLYMEGSPLAGDGVFFEFMGELMINSARIEDYAEAHFFWDSGENTLVITTFDKVYRFQPDRDFYMENNRPVDLITSMQLVHGQPYLPLSFLEPFLTMDWIYRDHDQVLVMDEKRECRLWAEVISKEAVIRQAPDIKAPQYDQLLSEGDGLLVYETHEHWLKVRADNGLIGYIQKKDVKRYEECRRARKPAAGLITGFQPEKGKINLVWEHVHRVNPDPATIGLMPGLDVVSPTWYEVADGSGRIISLVSERYLAWARQRGYEIWPLVSNGFDPDRTSAFLASTATRESIINELLQSVKQYQMDGLNIDFENVYLVDRDLVTQFVRELTPLFREAGLVVSMDVTIRSTSEVWSMFYDREALAKVVDYMAIMTYDQHWGSSPVAGSVAQYTWVEKGLKGILEQVPAEKVLLGLPTYTRLWEERTQNGETKVSSRALFMSGVQNIIAEKGLEPTWDEESGQYYAEYTEGGSRFLIWIEDARSIDLKASLVHKYNLAGTASWRRGFETPDIWQVLEHTLKDMKDYTSWAQSRGLDDLYF